MTEAADVIDALRSGIGRLGETAMEEEEASDLSPLADLADHDRATITGLLGPSPAGIDDLVRLSGASPAAVRTVLLELELAGRVVRHGAAMVSLIS